MTRMQGLTVPANLAGFAARQREQAEARRKQHGIEAQAWYSIRNAADPDEAEVLLYDEIGCYWGVTADQFIADLRGITAPNLRVRINSPGGSVFEGIAIANALRSHPGNVTVQVDSVAASIASVIAMAGDRVEMAPNSMLMIHDASGLCYGNAADMQEMGQLLDLLSDNIADAYAAKAGGTRDEWRALMRAETWYLPADAVEAGLADEALAVPKQGEPVEQPDEEEPDMMRAWDLAAYGYTGPRAEQPNGETESPGLEPASHTLAADIRSLIGEEVAAQLAAAVAPPAEPAAAEPQHELRGEHGPELVDLDEPAPEAPAAEPDNAWAAAAARFAQPQDPWATAVARFTSNTSASSAATNAA